VLAATLSVGGSTYRSLGLALILGIESVFMSEARRSQSDWQWRRHIVFARWTDAVPDVQSFERSAGPPYARRIVASGRKREKPPKRIRLGL
jgi:hypothetical protein